MSKHLRQRFEGALDAHFTIKAGTYKPKGAPVENGICPHCNHCNNSWTPWTQSGLLRQHLNNGRDDMHKKAWAEYQAAVELEREKKNIPKHGQTTHNVQDMINNARKQSDEKLNTLIFNFFIENNISFRALESQSFKNLVGKFDKGFVVPNRKLFWEKVLESEFQKTSNEISERLETMDQFVIEIDKLKKNNRNYYGINVSFFQAESIKKNTNLIGFEVLTKSDTGQGMKEAVEAACERFGLDATSAVALIADGDKKCGTAARLIGIPWINCGSHALNNSFYNAVDENVWATNLLTQIRAFMDKAVRSDNFKSWLKEKC
jgi:hypothetical protein